MTAKPRKLAPAHRHRFEHQWRQAKRLGFRCACGIIREREMTKGEAKLFRAEDKTMFNRSSLRCLDDFRKRFQTAALTDRRDQIEALKQAGFRYKGYDLMKRVSRWALRWPEHVNICHVDDHCAAGAILVFIQIKSACDFSSVSVFYLSQFAPPAEFTLRLDTITGPSKRGDLRLLEGLKHIVAQGRSLDRAARARARSLPKITWRPSI